MPSPSIPIAAEKLAEFGKSVFDVLRVHRSIATAAVQSLIDASLLGVDTHGIEALDMYVEHIRAGGLDANTEPVLVAEKDTRGLWDMRHGFGLSGTRTIMRHAIARAQEHGLYMASCNNANHLGACGVYGKMAADIDLIGMVSQQTIATFSPFGGTKPRIGASPMAFVAPVESMFPFYYDASFASIARATIKNCIRNGQTLPEGVAVDNTGLPTTDPQAAWHGQLLPIGGHKGVGLSMVFEVLTAVLAGGNLSVDIPSIVNQPHLPADSSIFICVIDPDFLLPKGQFARMMARYVSTMESSPAIDPKYPPSYPGRREGKCWHDRIRHGIPISPDGMARLNHIAKSLELEPLRNDSASQSANKQAAL